MSRQTELAANASVIEDRVRAACAAAGRDRSAVTVIAVTKTWPASDALLLRDLGLRDLGENRDQEAVAKAAAVSGVTWHFIGAVQTNKAASVASYADVVHAVDRTRLVAALGAGAVRAGRTVRAFVQVSLDGAPGRGGAAPDDALTLCDAVAATEGLVLAGVMAVAPLGADPDGPFARLSELAAHVRSQHPTADQISAGMSGDLESAVRHGSTHLRVGTAFLGVRPPVRR